MFRVLGSSKFRRDAVLRVLPPESSASSSAAPATTKTSQLDSSAFLDALVCPFPTLHALRVSPAAASVRLLRCDQSDSVLKHRSGARPLWAPPTIGHVGVGSNRLSSAHAVESRESVFPKIDAFILSNACHGGIQGEIRVVQMLFDNVVAILPGDSVPSEDTTTSHIGTTTTKTPWMIVYQMARNRWCWNVRRAHKSNNVMFVVDLSQRVFYQKCHDQNCKAVDYRFVLRRCSSLIVAAVCTSSTYSHSAAGCCCCCCCSRSHPLLLRFLFVCLVVSAGRRRCPCRLISSTPNADTLGMVYTHTHTNALRPQAANQPADGRQRLLCFSSPSQLRARIINITRLHTPPHSLVRSLVLAARVCYSIVKPVISICTICESSRRTSNHNRTRGQQLPSLQKDHPHSTTHQLEVLGQHILRVVDR